jgi:phosphonopyruvate decarboxylase
MGRITGRMLEEIEIPWDWFPAEEDGIDAILDRIDDHHRGHARPFALVMRKGSVAPFPLPPEKTRFTPGRTSPGTRESTPVEAGRAPSRREVLARIVAQTPEDRTVVIGTTGYTGRELSAIADRANQFYMVGSMGCAASIGLGLSLARPDLRIVVVDGDGAALMRMGNFATVGAYGQSNLIHLLLDNACHESTGAQATVSAGVSFARIAQACGYGIALEGSEIDIVDRLLEEPTIPGPRFGRIHLERGVMENLPRPGLKPEAVHRRLARHLEQSA